jgi:Protein-disulfide isomerase
MKRYLPFIIVVGVALVTFGSGTMLYRAKRPQVKNIPEGQSVAAKSDASAHVRGNPDAPVTLEEFADFQCPPCGQFAPFAEELLREYDSRLRVVFRNFPLPAHEHAREAALAAEAAGFQGKFWEMHDTLYREHRRGARRRMRGNCLNLTPARWALIWTSSRKIWTATKRGNASIPTMRLAIPWE